MKLYSSATSDTGGGAKTRGGMRRLCVTLTADTVGGRSEVDVTMDVEPDGSVVLRTVPRAVKRGFRIG